MNEYKTEAQVKAYYAGRLYELCQFNIYREADLNRYIIALSNRETKALAALPDEWLDQPNGEGLWCLVYGGIVNETLIRVEQTGLSGGYWCNFNGKRTYCPDLCGKWSRVILPVLPHVPEPDPLLPKSDYETETAKLQEMLTERTLQHKTQLDNANQLRIEVNRLRAWKKTVRKVMRGCPQCGIGYNCNECMRKQYELFVEEPKRGVMRTREHKST